MEFRILKEGPRVVNFGIEAFHDDQKTQGAASVQVDWKPPAIEGSLLSRLKKLKKGGAL